ncbi:MAG: DUF368 domain-containing protein [Myxococcales bacterium]|jgi:putative membrane protein
MSSPELETTRTPDSPAPAAQLPEAPLPQLVTRSAFGGLLMGLANLVPGISGGTMLLASGVYQNFVNAVAELSTLKLRLRSLVVLGTVVAAAGMSILLFAGPVKGLVVDHRWAAYSLFIGLTLGGVPVIWKMVGRADRSVWIGAAAGLVVMVVIAVLQMRGASGGAGGGGLLTLFVAGVVGASAMILPGISGSYMLLVLGQYVAILAGIDAFKSALLAVDIAAAVTPFLDIILPVGLGVVVGVVAVSNLLKMLFARFEKPTLGVLLGLLVGAVVGLWPFQRGVAPQVGDVIKGRTMTPELIASLKPEDWPTAFVSPSALQVLAAIGLVVAGFATTALVARLGRER